MEQSKQTQKEEVTPAPEISQPLDQNAPGVSVVSEIESIQKATQLDDIGLPPLSESPSVEKKPKRQRKKKESLPAELPEFVEEKKPTSVDGVVFSLDDTQSVQAAPKTSQEAPPTQTHSGALVDEASMKLLIKTVFDSVAAARGNHWKLNKEEEKVIVPPATRVVNKYAPKVVGQYSDEIALAIAAFGIVYARIAVDIEEKKQKERVEKIATPVQLEPQTLNPIVEKPSPVSPVVDKDLIRKMYPGLN